MMFRTAAVVAAVAAVAIVVADADADADAADSNLAACAIPIPSGYVDYNFRIGQQYLNFSSLSTTSADARTHFFRGLGHLHNFGYSLAEAEFIVATHYDPSLAIAYAFAALSNWMPNWELCYPAAAIAHMRDLNRCASLATTSPQERGLIQAVGLLFSNSSAAGPVCNASAYVPAMQALTAAFPSEQEIWALYAVSLFALILPEDRGFLWRSPASAAACSKAIAQVLQMQPLHPGALHYRIHLNDQPYDARPAYPMALLYPRVAPSLSHAQHMPSHLQLRLGLFADAQVANLLSVQVSTVAALVMGESMKGDEDFHSYEFVHYAHLQLGKYMIAAEELDGVEAMALIPTMDPDSFHIQAGLMRARARVELFEDFLASTIDPAGCPWQVNCTVDCVQPGMDLWWRQSETGLITTCGLLAAARGRSDLVDGIYLPLLAWHAQDAIAKGRIFLNDSITAMMFQIRSFEARAAGNSQLAVAHVQLAADIETASGPPTYGPPMDPIKPSLELLGEVLLSEQRFAEAVQAFLSSSIFFPNRSRTLVGLARASVGLANMADASYYYFILAEQQRNGDFDLGAGGSSSSSSSSLGWYGEALQFLQGHPYVPGGSPSSCASTASAAAGGFSATATVTVLLVTVFVLCGSLLVGLWAGMHVPERHKQRFLCGRNRGWVLKWKRDPPSSGKLEDATQDQDDGDGDEASPSLALRSAALSSSASSSAASETIDTTIAGKDASAAANERRRMLYQSSPSQ